MTWSQARWMQACTRALSALAILAVLAGLFMAAAHVAVHRQTAARIHQRTSDVPQHTAAIVLGALVYSRGRLSDTVADRVDCALSLYRAGKVKRILVSGDHGRRGYDEVNAMADALVRANIPERDVFLDHAGFRTLDSMHRAAVVFQVHDAVVCTQRFHLPRALYLAAHFGIDAHGLVADRRRYRSALYNGLREGLAVTAAFAAVLLGRRAQLLGPPIPISGDSRPSRDRLL